MASADPGEVGAGCTQHGIWPSMLLSDISKLPELESVTNEIVLELARFKDRHSQCTFKDLYAWIKGLFGMKWPEQAPNHQAVAQSIKRLLAGLSKLKKCSTSTEREGKILEYLMQDYALPQLGFCRGRVVRFGTAKQSSSKTEQHLKQKMYSITRNANKRLKHRRAIISKQKICIESQHQKIKTYERKLQGAEARESRAKISRVNHRVAYWRARVDSIKHQTSAKKTKQLQHEVKQLKEEISALDFNNAELSETIESILSSKEIATFEGGKYTDDVRTCVYELLSLSVGVCNIAPIIRCVLKNIAHKTVGRLPSHGLTCQMILESLTIAQAQLGEKLGEGEGESLEYHTLQTDGTTKYGEHFGTYDVRTSKQVTYTLGLRHVFSGAAVDTLDTLKEILDDT